MRTRVLIPSGVLGLGFSRDALAAGMAKSPDIICIDGGSTDSGPYYLGTGTSKYSRAATKSEWRDLMIARQQAGIPLIIGSCGTCGSDSTVDWMLDITEKLADELGQKLKIAIIYSEQSPTDLAKSLEHIHPLNPAPEITAKSILNCTHIVALAGAEHINEALSTGADIVLAGRTTDTATISAFPMSRGCNAGIAWHGAKIGECGALCSTNPTSGVILIDFEEDSFTVEPLEKGAKCTPHSVSAHMLYENADPNILYEPGGHLDVTEAVYAALDESRVRVKGGKWIPSQTYRVKLEGAKLTGYQTTIMATLRDPHYVNNARQWADKLQAFLLKEISQRMGMSPPAYDLEFRLIGIDATLGELETARSVPHEVGVLGIITAQTQEIATEIGKLINPFVLHFPLTRDEELPTFAFPFSPAQSDRGATFEFSLNHTSQLAQPMDAFRLVTKEIGHG